MNWLAKLKWWPGDDDPEPIAEPEVEENLPLPARHPTTCVDAPLPKAPPEPVSPMQQAVIDSGLEQIEGLVPAFKTNEGTVFLGSPADMARQSLMDSVHVARGPTHYPTNAEIDRLMKEED